MTFVDEIVTPKVVVSLTDDHIIVCRQTPNASAEFTLQDAKDNMEAVEKLMNGRKLPVLTFMSDSYISKEARHFLGSYRPIATAAAMVASGSLQLLLSTLFIGFSKVSVPTKIFKDQASALEWLAQYKYE